jgi:hypothetical protein
MRHLRSNTATRVTVGPFLDKTDGITPEVALTATNEKLTLVVDDAGVPTLILDVAATASGGANDLVHITADDAGYYDLELAAANVNYLGRACLSITYVTDHCPVFHEFMILPGQVFDSMYSAVGSAATFGIVDQGTVGAAATTTTSCDIRAAAAFTTSQLVGATIVFSTGEARSILTQTNDSITFDALITAPTASTTTYTIFGSPPASTTTPMPVDAVKISGNTAAADNCQLMFDGTGYGGGTTLLTVDATKISASAAAADNLETAFASTIAELAAIPAANAPLWTAIKYLFLLARNKITQTSTTQLVKADDGTTTVATYTISDDATTYTRNEGA